MNYEELKADVIKIGIESRYDTVLYLVSLGYKISPFAIHLIEKLYKEGILLV